jgi:amino acid adenylation domain-containing protein
VTSFRELLPGTAKGPIEATSGGTLRRAWHGRPPILHQLVRAGAAETPDRIAAVYQDQWVSYSELVARSGSWAARLRTLGVDVGTLVGVHLERSLDLPVIVLAVLEAGGVCIPLEPSDPPERVAAMIQQTQPSVIVTHSRLGGQLPTTAAAVVTVDDQPPELAPPPEAPLSPDNLAFVHLTSGSTGAPKGVMVSHATVAARMVRQDSDVADPGTCMAIMKTPISNSPFLGEMFAPLLHGCYFVIARPDGHQDIPYLAKLIVDHSVTHIAMTSTVLRAFLEWPGAADCRTLKSIHCGGEAVTDDLRRRFFECFPNARLVVTYGTTESGHKLSCQCRAGVPLDGTRIGRPIPNAHVQLLDPALEPTAPGEVGEIYLGGPRLAVGYLNRPAWTAERFVPDPFSTDGGERLYRSGDLGRVRPDGELEFTGRTDQMVKVHGNRVELLEIESALADCPGVREAVVVARAGGRGDAQLVAYIVANDKPGPTAAQWRDRLSQRLPPYMVPGVFIALDEIPRTQSGKLDRRALANREPGPGQQPVNGYAAPRTPTERILAEIWQTVLGVERVGRDDNFFALGGHSIVATRACVELESRLRRRISPAFLFAAPNLADLADAIDRQRSSECPVVIVPLQPAGRCPPLFLMPKLNGSPWIARGLLRHLDPQRPVFALGLADENAPWGERVTLEEIAGHCVAALREAKVDGPLHVVGHSFGGIVAYEVARQLHAAGMEVGRVVIIDSWLELPGNSLRARLRNLAFFFANLPRWVFQFVFKRSPAVQLFAVRRRFRSWRRRAGSLITREPAVKRLDWSMDRQDRPEQLRKRMDTYFSALQSYVPGPYSGRVLLFRAKVRPLLHGLTPDLNWGRFVTGPIEVIAVPGNHHSILKANYKLIAERLHAVLDRK